MAWLEKPEAYHQASGPAINPLLNIRSRLSKKIVGTESHIEQRNTTAPYVRNADEKMARVSKANILEISQHRWDARSLASMIVHSNLWYKKGIIDLFV